MVPSAPFSGGVSNKTLFMDLFCLKVSQGYLWSCPMQCWDLNSLPLPHQSVKYPTNPRLLFQAQEGIYSYSKIKMNLMWNTKNVSPKLMVAPSKDRDWRHQDQQLPVLMGVITSSCSTMTQHVFVSALLLLLLLAVIGL